MATHVQQHYVPKFLLEHWHTGLDSKLTAFRWAHTKLDAQRYKAKSVARLAHLYSFARSNGELDVGIERDYMGPYVDEPAAQVHQALLRTGLRLDEQQHRDWVRFLVSMMLRGPAMMAHINQVGRSSLAETLEADPADFDEIRGDAKEESLVEWFEAREAGYMDSFGTRMLPELIQQQRFTDRFIGGKTWMLMGIGSTRHDLLIGDRPLIQDGALDADHAFLMPIAPRLLFAVASNGDVAARIKALPATTLVTNMNLMTVSRAEAYVFGTSAIQAAYVRKHLPRRA